MNHENVLTSIFLSQSWQQQGQSPRETRTGASAKAETSNQKKIKKKKKEKEIAAEAERRDRLTYIIDNQSIVLYFSNLLHWLTYLLSTKILNLVTNTILLFPKIIRSST